MEDDPGPDHPAALGRPHAAGRRRRAGLRLHRPDGHPLAHADLGPERLGPGRGRLGPEALESGRAWTRRQPPTASGRRGRVGGQFAAFPNNPIADTDDDPLYQTVRYDMAAYRFDVPNGTYTVTLQVLRAALRPEGQARRSA